VNDRKNVPNVEGAITRNGNTRCVAPARQDRRDQRADLAARTRATNPTDEPDGRVHQRLHTEARHQRCRQQQPRVRDQRLVVERHVETVDRMRY